MHKLSMVSYCFTDSIFPHAVCGLFNPVSKKNRCGLMKAYP